MKIRLWPRTIGLQLLAGLVLLEALSLGLFSALLLRQLSHAVYVRAEQRLLHQANSLALQTIEGLQSDRPGRMIGTSVRMLAEAPSVASAKITDVSGKVLYSSLGDGEQQALAPGELTELEKVSADPSSDRPQVFIFGNREWESIKPVRFQGRLYGYAWVKTDRDWDQEQIQSTFRSLSVFGVTWIAASILLAWGMGRSISRPLAVLQRGTRALMQSPENASHFPLPVKAQNEVGEVIEAFNRMVASIEEQRNGLSDTLSLLDSMLANAPIGLAFFDGQLRFVRVNRIFAEGTGMPLSRHLGRTMPEVLPPAVANVLDSMVQTVFQEDHPVRDVEVEGFSESSQRAYTWIVSAYPVHTLAHQVRWVGLIVMDASDRKRSEEALRKTEKLAATGRLAASIAHEINNPLEAITNLLFLLSTYPDLNEGARSYAQMAEHEVRRISEITQQTLRFYRQSTLPARANLSELLDSVLTLHQGRLRNLEITIERHYDPATDLYCFAGELRQVFANLVGNAIDAMPNGGKLSIRARRSRDWARPERSGIRFQVADSGSGMELAVQKRIFEAFFTTKEVTGTGLGLWVSWEIIAKHQGVVRVRSRVATATRRSGTVFELFFPDDVELAVRSEQK